MLYDKLKNWERIPFHMPGHKRNTALLGNELPYNIDITEIVGLDNLHNPNGIIRSVEKKAEALYGSKHSFILVNGSTAGILSAVHSALREGDTVLMARNCHRSVYNAVELVRANARYIYPEYDEFGIARGIRADQVKDLLDHSVKLIILTSPTYEGVKSELAEICELAHGINIPVLVDAAHGAHFFSEYSCADMVVMSLHKTLPALTQCAVLHIYEDLCSVDKLALSLSIFETSSPSYVLMSSAEICIDFCINNISAFSDYRKNLRDFYQIKLLKLKLLKYDDMGKLVVFCGGYLSGFELADILRKNYNIEIEMSAPDYIICMTSVCDSKENLEALKNALESIDSGLGEEIIREKMTIPKEHNKVIMPPFEVNDSNESYSPEYSAGKMSSEYIFAYPPGIPLVVPGEIINEELADYIVSAVNSGANMLSSSGLLPDKIKCQKI